MDMEKLLTPQQVAEMLGVKLTTIYKWSHLEQIPHIKVGRLLRFRSEMIENWLTENTNGCSGPEQQGTRNRNATSKGGSSIWEKHFR